MHHARVEDLKRAEREAAQRVVIAKDAQPYDPVAYKRAAVEWRSAQLALRSRGVRVKDRDRTTAE